MSDAGFISSTVVLCTIRVHGPEGVVRELDRHPDSSELTGVFRYEIGSPGAFGI